MNLDLIGAGLFIAGAVAAFVVIRIRAEIKARQEYEKHLQDLRDRGEL